jgi:hypothetical protein
VLGLPRSGTSMVAGCLEICGAWTGRTVPGSEAENPKGFFEHVIIREQITKQLLTRLGCDPLGVRKLPPVDLQGEVSNLAEIIRVILEKEGYAHDRPWLYKDAKLTLLWPIYKKSFPDAKWVIVSRVKEEVIDSCLRTSFMRQHSGDRDYWERFVAEYVSRLNALKDSGASVLEISSSEIIEGSLEGVKNVVDRLGLTYRETELQAFVTPSYWHGQSLDHTQSGSKFPRG